MQYVDKYWKLHSEEVNDNVYFFLTHRRTLKIMAMSPEDYTQLLRFLGPLTEAYLKMDKDTVDIPADLESGLASPTSPEK